MHAPNHARSEDSVSFVKGSALCMDKLLPLQQSCLLDLPFGEKIPEYMSVHMLTKLGGSIWL